MKILQPKDVAQRLAAGETAEAIFFDPNGGYAAKLVGPEVSVGAIDEAARSVEFVITSEAVDRYTDVVALGGWQTKNFVRNPVVLWGHDDSIPAIARGGQLRFQNKQMRDTAIFAERDYHPLADTVFQLVKAKFISAASVGFIPLKAKAAAGKERPYGLDIIEQELLEWSVVNIPANPECLVQARSIGIDTAPLIGWAERVLDKGGMLLIPRAELEALRKAAGAPTVGKPIAPQKPTRKIKSLWHVAWLADILMDIDCLEGCVEFEAALEEDGSAIPQRLLDTLKALGQILIDMTAEEVAELLADPDGEAAVAPAAGEPMAASARVAFRKRLLKQVATMPKAELATATLKDLIAAVSRAGRALSGENEKKLQKAYACMNEAAGHVNDVLGTVAGDDDDDEDEADAEKAAAGARERKARALKRRLDLRSVA